MPSKRKTTANKFNNKTGPFCGAVSRARRRNGDPNATCILPAGFGTDHVGQGKCRYHGGATPITHGRYSTVKRNNIKDLFDQLLTQDVNPLDLIPDLTMCRAMLIDFVNRYQEFSAALIHWHDSFVLGVKMKKPMVILDIADASKMIERVARIVSMITKIQEEGSISIDTFKRLQEQMALVIAKHVSDPKALRGIEKDWQEIHVVPTFN